MENICDYKNCCACGLCASICPTNAISLVSDSFGFFYPTIDRNKCIDCRKCSQSCINNATFPNPVSEHESCYSYSTSDQKIIEQCASGGAAHDLYAAIIALGGVAYGIAYSEDYSFAGYCRVTEINQLSSLLGTKYFHARPNIDLYQSIENDLKKGCPVIFIGLPCEVAALRLRFHNSFNLYLVDIFCHGVTSETIHEKKVNDLKIILNGDLEYFNVKHKINKWTSNPPLVACGNGTVFSEDFYNSDYGCAFTNFSRESCYHCKFKGNEKKGDLSIGDFWGIENLHIKYNKLGVSAIISRTKRGEELCHYLATRGVMRECSLQSIVSSNPWVNSSISKSKYYIKYKHNLPKSSKLYMPVRFRLKTVLKKVVTWSRKH